jgi:hypothetical protein
LFVDFIENEIYLSSLDLSDSDDDEDEDDDVELSCFRRGGFCIVGCELLAVLIIFKFIYAFQGFLRFLIESYFERLVDELFLLLPDESESRLTGTT